MKLLNLTAVSVGLFGYKQEKLSQGASVKEMYGPLWTEGKGGDQA